MAEPFQFHLEHDGSLSLESAVFQALGAASVCWDDMSGTGVFHESQAKAIGEALVEFIKQSEDTAVPLLGLATTELLFDELIARMRLYPPMERVLQSLKKDLSPSELKYTTVQDHGSDPVPST